MIRRLLCSLASVAIVAPLLALSPAPPPGPILGYTQEHAAAEHAAESTFDASMNAAEMKAWLRRLSARPHHLGSPYDKANAAWLVAQFQSWGWDAKLETFQVLFSTPKERKLELLSPTRFVASLQEKPLKEDHTSNQVSEQLPTYNAYSIGGDVTAPLVYVNYGIPADYEILAQHGIDVKGKIVIARYGGSWRGIKPKVAAEHGAVGCIIYSDPRDDGYWGGNAYPNGTYRNATSAQRGSVADIPTYSGDPSTGGEAPIPGAKRLAIKDIPTLTKIPVLPISYTDALPFLRSLGGPVAPAAWRGALPITYHLGAGPARVHLKLDVAFTYVTAYDIIAKMAGSERSDEWIVRGNHHDGWVNGAADPLSGAVAVMEEAKAIAALTKTGWKPKRTLVYCLWDGEEPGLLGSSSWAEAHEAELRDHAAVYVNSDGNGRGFLFAQGSHSLERTVDEVAREVVDPERGVSIERRQLAAQKLRLDGFASLQADDEGGVDVAAPIEPGSAFHLEALGSGSDYTPFVQHVGVAAINLGFGGESGNGSYHSIFDSFDEYTRFKDPTFAYGLTLAKTAGRIVLRFADADVLPYAFAPSADTIARYAREVAKLVDDEGSATLKRNALIDDGSFTFAADPRETFVAPTKRSAVPTIDFSALNDAVAALQTSAQAYDAALGIALSTSTAPSTASATDRALLAAEHTLTTPTGLPRRPWYRHQLYAPGFYTGYGVKTMPYIREAIEQRNWDEARTGIVTVAAALLAYRTQIDIARVTLAGK